MVTAERREFRSIGEVLALLQGEFPDVTVSKIRFLEAQGLIEPERTPSGYRRFREHDVQRLRDVLALQRDQFLPLRVIRERLDGEQTDEPAEEPNRTRRPTLVSGAAMRRDELLHAAGVDARTLDDLLRFGLISAREVQGEQVFDETAVVVARIAARFAGLGLDVRHVRTLKVAFDRERLLYEQLLLPLSLRPSDRAVARERHAELADLGAQLRRVFLDGGVDPGNRA